MNKNTGGPAFPRPIGEYKVQGAGKYNDAQKGMTLRDYFAAAAMQGALAGEPGGHLIPDRLAANSYRYADAMLAARECEQAALPQAEQPEAGRDVQRLAMVAAEQIAEEAHPKLDQYKRGPEVRRYAEIIAIHFKGTHPQAQEAVAWRCDECGCTSRERIDEQQPDGSFAPGPSFRCVECKKESHPPTSAEAVRLLARTLPWIEFANEKAGEAGDKKNSADLYDDVSEFLAQHGGRGDVR